MSFSEIAILACGNYNNHPSVTDVFFNVASNISRIEKRVIELPAKDDENITMLGPFYGRTLIESTCTALVGRIDPFRLLFLKNVQIQDKFGLGSRSNAAIKWSEDIFEQGLDNSAKKPEKMWGSTLNFRNIDRGLLGDYYGELFWRKAYEHLLDQTADYPGEDILSDFRSTTKPEGFMPRIRQEASRLYSSLSKGVHSELVVRAEIIYDRTTVLDLLSDTLSLCGILSLVSHLIDSTICRMDINECISVYRRIKERSEVYGQQ